eukprot:gene8982-2956_t
MATMIAKQGDQLQLVMAKLESLTTGEDPNQPDTRRSRIWSQRGGNRYQHEIIFGNKKNIFFFFFRDEKRKIESRNSSKSILFAVPGAGPGTTGQGNKTLMSKGHCL